MTIRYYSYFGGEENHTHVMFGNDITKENWIDHILKREFGDMDVEYDSSPIHESYYAEFDDGDYKEITVRKDNDLAEVEVRGGYLGFYMLEED